MDIPPEIAKALENAELVPHVYFMACQHVRDAELYIRIGFSAGKKKGRIEDHLQSGADLLAVLPATQTDEGRLHDHFKPVRTNQFGSSTSHYQYEPVKQYVDLLLANFRATPNPEHLCLLGRVPYSEWKPGALVKPAGFLGYTERQKTSARDSWQTPAEVFEAATRAFGAQIDLDPASCLEAYLRPKPEFRPKFFYTEKMNGLQLNWFGNIFLNPPYGKGENGETDPGAKIFTEKLIKEVQAERVTGAIMVLNLQSVPTIWFQNLNEKLKLTWAIARKRIDFFGMKAKSGSGERAYGASRNGTIFLYYGPNEYAFWKEFYELAYPLLSLTKEDLE